MEHSSNQICFLDVMVTIHDDNIVTSVYSKPTDRHTFMHFKSFHPIHIKHSIAYIQLIRYRRICSRRDIFIEKAAELVDFFLYRGYPYKLLSYYFSRALSTPRTRLLSYSNTPTPDRIPLVTNFHPSLKSLLSNVRRSWKILQCDPSIAELFESPPLL
ncbi:hypothetical protein HOLleu_20915 [Holothuria leucospilota]|uniref:Helix-turn-helix domain-containing protein n=1 Tax=Holothuria leucospilota TaxID=206669 RepID=A0A9Q1H5M8_HOLLE|nr:hypothetical protein HOLleu_20915 [Holothuria leucospilota]